MFKIGDTVKVKIGWWKGQTGVVEYLGDYEGQVTYGVRLDVIEDKEEGNCYNETTADELELVE